MFNEPKNLVLPSSFTIYSFGYLNFKNVCSGLGVNRGWHKHINESEFIWDRLAKKWELEIPKPFNCKRSQKLLLEGYVQGLEEYCEGTRPTNNYKELEGPGENPTMESLGKYASRLQKYCKETNDPNDPDIDDPEDICDAV